VALLAGTLCALLPLHVGAQAATDLAALKGLAPVTVLSKTPEGTAALAANFTVTGGIQTGAISQPTLLPFAEQQQQALRNAFITDTNLAQAVAGLIAYADATTSANSSSGKYFFGNGTTNGAVPASAEAMAILKWPHGYFRYELWPSSGDAWGCPLRRLAPIGRCSMWFCTMNSPSVTPRDLLVRPLHEFDQSQRDTARAVPELSVNSVLI
jgi:hypothetical protein